MLLNINLRVHSNHSFHRSAIAIEKKSTSHSQSLFRKQETQLTTSLNPESYGVNKELHVYNLILLRSRENAAKYDKALGSRVLVRHADRTGYCQFG